MKKVCTTLFALIMIISASFINPVNAQSLETDDIMIEVYYGFPNLFTTVLKNTYANDPSIQSGLEISGVGPIGFRGEYMVTDKFGFGIDVNYSNTRLQWTEEFSGTVYNYELNAPRFRVMGKFNFHFASSDVFDAYSSVGAGYNSAKITLKTNDPSYTDEEQVALIPIAFRLAIGARYFFTDNIGANLEFGLGGGALMHVGLSYKL